MREQIKRDLPNFPDDVVSQFLVPFAEVEGWPPQVDYKSNIRGRWKNILRNDNLAYWKGVNWTKQKLKLTPNDFIEDDSKLILGLVQANVQNVTNMYNLLMENTKERFERICGHLKEIGEFPKTPAIEGINGQYRILDGCHRLAAYFYLYGYSNIKNDEVPCLNVLEEQEYWVGKRELERK